MGSGLFMRGLRFRGLPYGFMVQYQDTECLYLEALVDIFGAFFFMFWILGVCSLYPRPWIRTSNPEFLYPFYSIY